MILNSKKALFFVVAIFLTLLLSLISCATTDKTHEVSCFQYVRICHNEASDICPDGYRVVNRLRPKDYNGDTMFTIRFRCREGYF